MPIPHQITQTYPRFQSLVYPQFGGFSTFVSTATTPRVLTAPEVLGGFAIVDAQDDETAVTLPAASAVAALIPAPQVGTAFEFTIRNSGDSTLTVEAGTGNTISGTETIATANSKRFLAVFTAVGTDAWAITYYSLGTVTT
jgi:hypothetical protein